jgi:hypothetical protein
MMHLSIFSRVRGNISTAPGIQKRYLPITEIIARESPRYVQDAKNPVLLDSLGLSCQIATNNIPRIRL